jgi:hypothetical protein
MRTSDVASPTTPMDSSSVSTPQNPLMSAMESVLSWTGTVVHGLHQLEWQTVGYESKTDGTADPERPIYRCPACWRYKDVMTYETAQHDTKCLIANLLLQYATETMGHLDYVLKSVERFPVMMAAHQKTQKMMNSMQQQQQGSSPAGHNSGPTLVSPQHMTLGGGGNGDGTSQMIPSGVIMTSNMSTATSNQFSMTSSSQASSMSTAPPALTRGLTEMMNGIEGPPGLFRNNSGGLTEFMRSLDDQENADSVFYQNLGGQSSSNHVADAIEVQVFYVLARMITLDSSNAIGFPAFDVSMNLLGFYQEGREAATTEVVFVPVSDIAAISQLEIAQTQRLLRTELKENSVAVHTLARCNNDLVKLKEDVILFHWNAKDRAAPTW